MSDNAAQNGAAVFDVAWLRDMVVDFEFGFEGRKLTGQWYKYKTTTPAWGRERRENYLRTLDSLAEVKARIAIEIDETAVVGLARQQHELDAEAQRIKYAWLADAITTWNAVDNGVPVPVEVLRLDSFPLPLLVGLGEHLEGTRTGENPTSPTS